MTTIPPLRVSEAQGLAREVYADIMRTYDMEEPHDSYMIMGYTPEHLAASWKRSRFLFGSRSALSLKDKHLLTLALSGLNGSGPCVRAHSDRVRQLGATKAELNELMIVVSTVTGASKRVAMSAVSDYARSCPYSLAPELVGQAVAAASERIAQLCFDEDGVLGLQLKHTAAFALAAASGVGKLIEYHVARLNELWVPADVLIEVLFIVDLTCGYNPYGQGVQAGRPKPFGPDAGANACAGGGRNWQGD